MYPVCIRTVTAALQEVATPAVWGAAAAAVVEAAQVARQPLVQLAAHQLTRRSEP